MHGRRRPSGDRPSGVVAVEGVPHVVALLADVDHRGGRPGCRCRGAGRPRSGRRPSGRARLAGVRSAVDGGHRGVEAAQLGVAQVEELGRRHRPSLPRPGPRAGIHSLRPPRCSPSAAIRRRFAARPARHDRSMTRLRHPSVGDSTAIRHPSGTERVGWGAPVETEGSSTRQQRRRRTGFAVTPPCDDVGHGPRTGTWRPATLDMRRTTEVTPVPPDDSARDATPPRSDRSEAPPRATGAAGPRTAGPTRAPTPRGRGAGGLYRRRPTVWATPACSPIADAPASPPPIRLELQVRREELYHRLTDLEEAMVHGADRAPRPPRRAGGDPRHLVARHPVAARTAPTRVRPRATATDRHRSASPVGSRSPAGLPRDPRPPRRAATGGDPRLAPPLRLRRRRIHPVKVLADALGHEHDAGRATRVARGVYGLAIGWTPQPGAGTTPTPPGRTGPSHARRPRSPPIRARPARRGRPGTPATRRQPMRPGRRQRSGHTSAGHRARARPAGPGRVASRAWGLTPPALSAGRPRRRRRPRRRPPCGAPDP